MRKLFVALVLIFFAIGCGSPEESNSDPTSNSAQIASDQSFPEEGPVSGFTDAHNAIRADYDVVPLAWDSELASIADDWAEHLAIENGCIMEHRPSVEVPFSQGGMEGFQIGNYVNEMFIGENLYWEMTTGDITLAAPSTVVNAWASEIQFYDYDSNSCQEGQMCGHYTQVIWSETTHVGCAYRICDDEGSQVWVCNYHPAGNMVGQRPY